MDVLPLHLSQNNPGQKNSVNKEILPGFPTAQKTVNTGLYVKHRNNTTVKSRQLYILDD